MLFFNLLAMYFSIFPYFLFFLMLIGNSTISSAQNSADSLLINGVQIEEWVVSAQRLPKNRRFAPYPIQLIDSTLFSQQVVSTTSDAAWNLPGVFLQKTNLGGGSPIVRGLMGNQIVLLYDGIRINNSTYRYGPNQYLNTINVFDLAEMELINGGSSAQFGSDAIGGAILLRSKQLPFSSKPELSALTLFRAASKDMEQTGFQELQFSSRKVSAAASITLRNFGDLFGGDTTGIQSPSGYYEFDRNVKARVQLGPRLEATFLNQQVKQHDVDVFHKIQLEQFELNQMELQERRLSYVKFHFLHKNKYFKTTHFSLHKQMTYEKRISKKIGQPISKREADNVGVVGFTIETEANFFRSASSTIGLEVTRELINSVRTDENTLSGSIETKRGLYPPKSFYESASLFLLNDYFVGNYHFSAGIRYQQINLSIQENSSQKVQLSPNALVGYFLVNYSIADGVWLNASCGTSYRAPNIDDLSSLGIIDFRYEVPNYNLRPERSFQQQLGIKLLKGPFQYATFLYHNNLFNLIERVRQDTQQLQGYPIYSKANIGKGFIRGLETTFSYQPYSYWTIKGALTWTYGQNELLDEPLRRIPPVFSSFSSLITISKQLTLTFEGLIAGKQNRLASGDIADNRIPIGGTPGWIVCNFHSELKWDYFRLQCSVVNLANRDYRVHGSGINGVGRSVWATLTFQF